MTTCFFDTSSLLKRYVIENGREWVIQTLNPANRNQVFIAQVTPVEIVSGISRLKRENIILADDAQKARLLIRRHIQREYRLVNFTNQIVEHAQDFLEKYPLRAYDAVQLASALNINTKIRTAIQFTVVFVSSDVRLLTVAISEGLQTYNPV